jgi:hypothetical protein
MELNTEMRDQAGIGLLRLGSRRLHQSLTVLFTCPVFYEGAGSLQSARIFTHESAHALNTDKRQGLSQGACEPSAKTQIWPRQRREPCPISYSSKQ